MHDCLQPRCSLHPLLLAGRERERKSRARKLRLINYQRLMGAFLSARKDALFRSSRASLVNEMAVRFASSMRTRPAEVTKWRHRPRLPRSRSFARNRFTLMATPRCASQLSQLLKQSIYTQVRPHGTYIYFFFLSPSSLCFFFCFILPATFHRRRAPLGSAVVFVCSS